MDIEQVIQRWTAGEAIRAIARATGLDRNTVRRLIRQAEKTGLKAGEAGLRSIYHRIGVGLQLSPRVADNSDDLARGFVVERLHEPLADDDADLQGIAVLDLAAFDGRFAPMPMGFGWHPHSGIATVTVMLEGAVRYAETTGNDGVLPPGGVEWMRAETCRRAHPQRFPGALTRRSST
jgi:hypothetical protein